MGTSRLVVRYLFGDPIAVRDKDFDSDMIVWLHLAMDEATVLNRGDSDTELKRWYYGYSSHIRLIKRPTTKKLNDNLNSLLLSTVNAGCKDDLDKVYGLLGVLDLFLPESISSRIPVDYARSVKDVYMNAFVLALEMSRTLNLKGFQNLKDGSPEGWPSWLPDLRIPYQRRLISDATLEDLDASAGLSEFQKHDSGNNAPFRVVGSRIEAFGGSFDGVCHVLEIEINYRLIRLLLKLAEILPSLICGRRKFEVIWRTLTHDVHRRREEQDLALLENEFLRWLTFNTFFMLERLDAEQHAEILESLVQIIQKFEMSSQACLREIADYIRERLEYLRNRDDDSFLRGSKNQRFTQAAAKFWTAARINTENRKLVVTQRGFLGSCSEGTAVGDEIWILDGARTPFVLRPCTEESSYTFVGDAFMLDLMNGEMLHGEHGVRDRLRYIDIV
ncbi:hypothetical protein ES702_04585 [subsurface metagenome]